jgi:SAM-dependent methyltransferase
MLLIGMKAKRPGMKCAYDLLAWFYDRYWGQDYHRRAFGIFDKLLLSDLPPGAKILDLACGTGHLTRMLRDRGYRMTGIDESGEMLKYARRCVPEAKFYRKDIRELRFPPVYEGAVSSFECMSHILEERDLALAFRNIHAALKPGGLFAFDITTEEAYKTVWNKSSAIVEDDNICIIRGGYEPAERIGKTEITMLRLKRGWRRTDVTVLQKAYSVKRIAQMLTDGGFRDILCRDAARKLAMGGDLGVGRYFFRAGK